MTKKGGEKARYNFSRNTRIVRAKNVGKKIVGKKCEKNFFYIHTYIVAKKWWEKSAKQFFQKHTNSASGNCGKKVRREEGRKTFFIFKRISRPTKGGGERRETSFPETSE